MVRDSHHHLTGKTEEAYANKEAHKLEGLYKQGKPLADELTKIHKEHPEEFNKIFNKMNTEAQKDISLPKVDFYEGANHQVTVGVESQDRQHDPTKQRAEEYHFDKSNGSYKQADASLKEGQKILGAAASSVVDEGGAIAKALSPVGEAFNWVSSPGGKAIETIIGEAGQAAKKAAGG